MSPLRAYTDIRPLRPDFRTFDEPCTLLVQDGRIERIIRERDADLPSHADVVPGNDGYAIPGLVDMHVHISEELIPQQLETFLRYGVTTVRDVGSLSTVSAKLAKEIQEGTRIGPRLYSFGEVVDGPEPFWPDISVVPEDENQVWEHVERIAQLGLSGVKFYFKLPLDLIHVGADACKEFELLSAAHVGGIVTAVEAVEAGVGCIEHVTTLTENLVPADLWSGKGSFFEQFMLWRDHIDPDSEESQRTMATFVDRGAMMVPTLAVMEAIAYGNQPSIVKNPALSTLDPAIVTAWKQMQYTQTWTDEQYAFAQEAFESMKQFTLAYWKSGAPIGVGSDTPNPFVVPGESLIRECELLQDCGLLPHEILRLTCQIPADYFSEPDCWGTLEVGKGADFVVLESDPLVNVAALRDLAFTVRRGERIAPY